MRRIAFLVAMLLLLSCNKESDKKPRILIYCGITMVKPMNEISSIFEKENNCIINIAQGGSEDLYQSLKASKTGDLYLPGSSSYYEKYSRDGFLLNYVEVGYNQMAFLVQKGNPLNIHGDLKELTNPNIAVFIGNPETCSAGSNGKEILKKVNLFSSVLKNSVQIRADSRDLNKHLLDKSSDVILNW
jgi:molybdate transport system substrate-binding protein